MVLNNMPARMSTLDSQYGRMRTGIVTVVNAFSAQVDVGGTFMMASFLRGIAPKVGDTVSLIRQDATWLIMGSVSSGGVDPVQNGSFENATTSGVPDGWRLNNISGTTRMIVVEEESAPAGFKVLELGPISANAESYVYSAPWSVTQGEVWTISAFARRYWPLSGTPPLVSAAVAGLWFANATDTYPTTTDDDSLGPFTPLTDEWVGISHTMTVPGSGTNFMRLGLRSAVIGGSGIQWDSASARRTG